ncbi:MAG TPA: ABC transporter permease [Candidatus Binatia bacterium]|nr:ABC transporter permease [Candidatus Binatia bacterium]
MRFAQRYFRRPASLLGVAIVSLIAAVAILGPMVVPYSPIAISHVLLGAPQPPSLAHPLGTDILGRDELARAMVGARISLTVGIAAMIIAIVVGTLYGAIAGAAGGVADAVLMRIVDALLSFPTFFLVIAVEALTNKFALGIIILVIGLLSWMGVARLVRAEVLSLRERDFVAAAQALGASPERVLLRHLIPNSLAPVIVAASFAVGDNILTEAGLSFLGLGVQIPTPSWGNMLQDALLPAVRSAWWLVATPGVLIVLTLFGFTLIGDGLSYALGSSSTRR